jgi:hypothetical protein
MRTTVSCNHSRSTWERLKFMEKKTLLNFGALGKEVAWPFPGPNVKAWSSGKWPLIK